MALTIELNGKKYTAPNPKVKLWRQIVKFREENATKDITDSLDDVLELLSSVFSHEDVTPEALEEHLDLSDLIPLFNNMVEWVNGVVMGRIEQIPNEETPTKKKARK